MDRILGPYSDTIYGLVRIVVGFLFLCHGAQKLFGVLGGMQGSGAPAEMFSLLWVAGVIEFFGGGLVMLGLFASWAAFVCSGQMAVAYFMVHQPNGLLPIQNHGELAALYAWIFLYIASRGAGPLSLDASMRGAR